MTEETISSKSQAVFCPVEATMNIICGKYKTLILWKLADCGTMRFSQLQKEVSSATQKMLTQQLRALEQDGLINRKVYPVIPPKVEYSLTQKGWSVYPILEAMYHWGAEYFKEKGIEINCNMAPPKSHRKEANQ